MQHIFVSLEQWDTVNLQHCFIGKGKSTYIQWETMLLLNIDLNFEKKYIV